MQYKVRYNVFKHTNLSLYAGNARKTPPPRWERQLSRVGGGPLTTRADSSNDDVDIRWYYFPPSVSEYERKLKRASLPFHVEDWFILSEIEDFFLF
jgi:hypothetical protein